MYNNIWSKYEALARILGISKSEIVSLCGSSDKIKITLSESQISKRAIRAFDKLLAQFEPDTQEEIFKLRDAIMTTNYKSITAKRRFTPLGNFLIAMGYTQTEFAEIMKTNEGMISKAVNNTQDKSDELYEKIKSWLTARYSVLSAKEQEKVDVLRAALDIVGNVKANPYRKKLIEIGALNPLPKPVSSTKEVEELKEYVKLLEEENGNLRDRVEELKEENEGLSDANARQMRQIADMNDEIMDLNRELETHNTANSGLQDGVHDLNQRIKELEEELERERDNSLYAQRKLKECEDELEAKIFRLEEEKEALIGMNENLSDSASPFRFENCIVNIYTKE